MRIYLWYIYCSKLLNWMRRDVNFENGTTKIVRKSKRGDREMTWQEVAKLITHLVSLNIKMRNITKFITYYRKYHILNCRSYLTKINCYWIKSIAHNFTYTCLDIGFLLKRVIVIQYNVSHNYNQSFVSRKGRPFDFTYEFFILFAAVPK